MDELEDRPLDSEHMNGHLDNMKRFSMATKFQKTVLSVLLGLVANKDDLKEIK
jgi:hypothetical protein